MALPKTLLSQTSADQAPAARVGLVLSGTYRLDAFLGQGMTGLTYNAWHLRQKQPFAVKVLHKELAPSHDRVSRLRQDLRALASLRRFGFLPVDLSFAPDGSPFLAAELLVGDTLRVRLMRGCLPVLAAGIVAAALARALHEAHRVSVVHGDLRPENVILPTEAGREVEAGQPVILDGALHHLRKRAIGLDETLPLGKLAYLAPEQAGGEKETADVAGDIFALGAILYECLTGKQAFGASELEVVLEKLSSPPPPLQLPREVGAPPGLSQALDEVIRKACARDPDQRTSSMEQFLVGLSQAFEKSGLPLPPPDERVPIDTLLSQNKALRKRTVAVRRLAPPAATDPTSAHSPRSTEDDDVADPSQILIAASFSAGEAKDAKDAKNTEKPAESKRNTAKQRVIRRTVRARDLSKLLAEVEAGNLSPEQAMALSAAGEETDETEEKSAPLTAEQKMAEEGRAKVLARAEAAKKNREVEQQQRIEKERQEAAKMQKRLLEQARAETLGRMRAEWEQSHRGKSSQSDKWAKDEAAAASFEQNELLEEAARQAKRLEAERVEAERKAAEDAQRERQEAEAAKNARIEAEKLQAELREKERIEAERAERVRLKAEREAEARKRAAEAEQARLAKVAEVEVAERAAQQAKEQAEQAVRLAAEAHQAQEADTGSQEWLDEIDEIVETPKKPPPMPKAVTEAAEAAARASQEALAAQEKARKAKEEAEAQKQAAQLAQQAAEAAEESRMRSASEFEEIIRAAQEARDREEALAQQIREAENRQRAAQTAREGHLAKAKRATRALAVIQHVQSVAQQEAAGDAGFGMALGQENSGSLQGTPASAPKSTLSDSAATPVRKPAPSVGSAETATQGAPKSVPPPRDPSGVFHPSQLPVSAMRSDLAAGYTGPHMVPSPIRPEGSGPYTNPHMTPTASRPEMSGVYGNQQMAPGLLSAAIPMLVTPVMQHGPQTSPHDYTLSRGQMATALGLTAVLSGLIGSLSTLLILRSQQNGPRPPILHGTALHNTASETRVEPQPKPSVNPSAVEGAKPEPKPGPETPPFSAGSQDIVPVAKPALRDNKTAFPPLRLSTEAATMPPKQSLWVRPAAAPADAKTTESAGVGDAKVVDGKTGDAKATDAKTADGKMAADGKAAQVKPDAKAATGAAKPGVGTGTGAKTDAKPPTTVPKPVKLGTDELRNPFGF